MKKVFALLVTLSMTMALLVGCGTKEPSSPKDDGGKVESPSETYTLSIGLNSVEGDIPYYLADYFKQTIEEKSGGRVHVDLYPGGQMGGDSEMIENVMSGALDFYCGNTSNTVPYVTEAAVLDCHWDFDNLEHFRRFIDGGFIDTMNEVYTDKGMRITSMAEVGMRQLLSNRKIESIDDMAGLKVRVMQNKYHIAAWKALGAAPTPMDWGETFVGLQQKMIDGVEQPYFFICSAKLYEVQDYMLMTNHLAQPAVLLMSESLYQNLPEDIRALVLECSADAQTLTRKACDNMMEDRLQTILDNGVEVVEVSPEMLGEMRERVKSANDLVKEDVGEEFFAKYAELRDATR